eukprot:scaffold1402_cov254-Pinguiococcus_pyrenoidosus.AAC.33
MARPRGSLVQSISCAASSARRGKDTGKCRSNQDHAKIWSSSLQVIHSPPQHISYHKHNDMQEH